jgi:hypothetical protein
MQHCQKLLRDHEKALSEKPNPTSLIDTMSCIAEAAEAQAAKAAIPPSGLKAMLLESRLSNLVTRETRF